MSNPERVALAASGVPAGAAAERAAFDYCKTHAVNELLVIHILETKLSRYGEIDQLASGSCKADFIDFINTRADSRAQSLRSRLDEQAARNKIHLRWVQKEGDPYNELRDILSTERVSLLFIGKGTPSKSFFTPPKTLAADMVKHCSCKIVTIPHEE